MNNQTAFLSRCFCSFILGISFTANVFAQTTDTAETSYKKYISLDSYLKPFWTADTIIDESILVTKDKSRFTANLLYKAKKIISVKAANYSRTYTKGADWELKHGKLIINSGASIPHLDKEEFTFSEEKPGLSMGGKVPGTFVLFSEGTYFSSRQISVTYIPQKRDRWKGPVPVFAEKNLSGTITKLANHEALKIVFYGNSIEAGYNASGLEHAPPYMPTWPELVIYNLRQHYGHNVSFANKSIPGKLAQWGQDAVSKAINPEKPDLVIIGFGMNDGAAKVLPDKYRENIEGIIDSVKLQNSKIEFILIAPMLPNPFARQNGLQSSYKAELDKLAGPGIIVADMTAVHAELLKHKSYQDMTGNNVNHPNDYLVRWYAQYISGFLISMPTASQ
jgi:lysophospholipase L1-like esterase